MHVSRVCLKPLLTSVLLQIWSRCKPEWVWMSVILSFLSRTHPVDSLSLTLSIRLVLSSQLSYLKQSDVRGCNSQWQLRCLNANTCIILQPKHALWDWSIPMLPKICSKTHFLLNARRITSFSKYLLTWNLLTWNYVQYFPEYNPCFFSEMFYDFYTVMQ